MTIKQAVKYLKAGRAKSGMYADDDDAMALERFGLMGWAYDGSREEGGYHILTANGRQWLKQLTKGVAP